TSRTSAATPLRFTNPHRLRIHQNGGRRQRVGGRRPSGGGSLGRFDFPIAAFFYARPKIAQLGAFLDDKCSAALRARFGDRLVRAGVVAVRIAAAAVENPAPAAPFGGA